MYNNNNKKTAWYIINVINAITKSIYSACSTMGEKVDTGAAVKWPQIAKMNFN